MKRLDGCEGAGRRRPTTAVPARARAAEDEAARQAHMAGKIPVALAEVGPQVLAKDPDIRMVDVLAVK